MIEKLTNPEEHRPDNFVYLAHGLMDWNGNGLTTKEIKERVERIRDSNQFYRVSMIGCLSKEAARKKFNYYKEISQIGTFGVVGLILAPACDDAVYVAWNCDLGSPHNQEDLVRFAQQHRRKTQFPLKLLTETKGPEGMKYNELILRGDKETKIQGIFQRRVDKETEQKTRILVDICNKITTHFNV